MDKKQLGYYGENLAAEYLVSRGYEILQRNFTIKGGEIDLIAQHGPTIVFVEVKTRTSNAFGSGEDAVDYWKKQRLRKAMGKYLEAHFLFHRDYRMDLVEVRLSQNLKLKEVEHFEDIEFW